MPASRSRYAPDAAPDYSHRFHAGNVGDVWKHLVLVEVLSRVAASPHVVYLESHAGEGTYVLGPTGEWREGIGHLWARADLAPGPIAAYASLVRRLGEGPDRPRSYPGSPALAAAVLGRGARLELWERDPATYERLRSRMAEDPRAEAIQGDGLAALETAIGAAAGAADAVVSLVDPPYGEKSDWRRMPDVIIRAARPATHACILLWYPVKSLTRPHAMAAQLETGGVEGTLAELIT